MIFSRDCKEEETRVGTFRGARIRDFISIENITRVSFLVMDVNRSEKDSRFRNRPEARKPSLFPEEVAHLNTNKCSTWMQ